MDLRAHRNEETGRWTLEGVEPSEQTFERMCQMLRDGVNFKFARYGDGEANCMIGKVGHNCDGHEYFPDLGTALNDAFYSNPKYMVGIQPLMVQQGTWERLKQREGYPKNIYDADVLHSASIDGRLKEFESSIKDRMVVLVGPQHTERLPFVFAHFKIPSINCWLSYKDTRDTLCRTMALNKDVVLLLCASMMSEVLIEDLKDEHITIIDCGSALDPLVGVKSRRYHHKLQWI